MKKRKRLAVKSEDEKLVAVVYTRRSRGLCSQTVYESQVEPLLYYLKRDPAVTNIISK